MSKKKAKPQVIYLVRTPGGAIFDKYSSTRREATTRAKLYSSSNFKCRVVKFVEVIK